MSMKVDMNIIDIIDMDTWTWKMDIDVDTYMDMDKDTDTDTDSDINMDINRFGYQISVKSLIRCPTYTNCALWHISPFFLHYLFFFPHHPFSFPIPPYVHVDVSNPHRYSFTSRPQ